MAPILELKGITKAFPGALANDDVSNAPYHDLKDAVPDKLKSEIEELKAMIISGEISDTGCISYPEHCPGGLFKTT